MICCKLGRRTRKIRKARNLKKLSDVRMLKFYLIIMIVNFGKSGKKLIMSTRLVLMMLNWVIINCIILKISV